MRTWKYWRNAEPYSTGAKNLQEGIFYCWEIRPDKNGRIQMKEVYAVNTDYNHGIRVTAINGGATEVNVGNFNNPQNVLPEPNQGVNIDSLTIRARAVSTLNEFIERYKVMISEGIVCSVRDFP